MRCEYGIENITRKNGHFQITIGQNFSYVYVCEVERPHAQKRFNSTINCHDRFYAYNISYLSKNLKHNLIIKLIVPKHHLSSFLIQKQFLTKLMWLFFKHLTAIIELGNQTIFVTTGQFQSYSKVFLEYNEIVLLFQKTNFN